MRLAAECCRELLQVAALELGVGPGEQVMDRSDEAIVLRVEDGVDRRQADVLIDSAVACDEVLAERDVVVARENGLAVLVENGVSVLVIARRRFPRRRYRRRAVRDVIEERVPGAPGTRSRDLRRHRILLVALEEIDSSCRVAESSWETPGGGAPVRVREQQRDVEQVERR